MPWCFDICVPRIRSGIIEGSAPAFAAYYTSAIWTNAHCVDGAQEILVDWADLDVELFVVRAGTRLRRAGTYPILDRMWKHPDYDGTTRSEDVGLIDIDGTVPTVLNLLPRDMAESLVIGQPLGTLGFPGELGVTGGDAGGMAIPTFKDGVLSALRLIDGGEASHVEVQYNTDTTGGTSGSAVFDHNGWVIALNHAEMRKDIPIAGGDTISIGVGSLNLGIRVDEAWDLIDHLESARAQAPRMNADSRRAYPSATYRPFPENWNGEVIVPR